MHLSKSQFGVLIIAGGVQTLCSLGPVTIWLSLTVAASMCWEMLADVHVKSYEFQDGFCHRGLIWFDFHWFYYCRTASQPTTCVACCYFFPRADGRLWWEYGIFPWSTASDFLYSGQGRKGSSFSQRVCGHWWLWQILWHVAQEVLHWVC